ncbi:MAG: cytochrome c maturation protein CcmE [Chloroflexi bacterium]|nr:MAG: cytochrome c maturation protein CcmE [Chloroflexota bacterium]TMF80532.1 MAG: cytochrome c maturation protein CcmE [Chloroflexota bacterium]TMF91222.1 MAG: cytochrome c maturation protein CcmE [Chloroflexota bacterium]TMG44228.1 MAG: cytochrome c maturation protein CcmE [Chloroflexota bacterium]
MTMVLRWGLPAAVVAACVGYLIYSASGGSTEYYLTVSELRANAPAGDVRVAGVVQDDVTRTDGGLHVTFTENDGTASMPVDYKGTLPDIFKPGITVVVEGTLGDDGVFRARTLLAKCPSRFSTQPYTQ